MAKYLVIVESPGKIKSIQSYLGSDYKVMASFGHIRVLDKVGKHNLGIDVDDKFQTHYVNDPAKKEQIKKLKDEVKKAEMVYIASDNDREGESIAQSLKEVLKLTNKTYKRIVFNEITKKAVLDAISKPGLIDNKMVESQEARRILDRIIGFRLSRFTMQKAAAKSAGRVQSASLKILVDREKEILAFVPKEYFEIHLPFKKDSKDYLAKYKGTDKKKIVSIKSIEDVNKIVSELVEDNYFVGGISSKERKISPKPPYTTSTFQQEVSAKLNYNSKRAMSIAQSLYEGKNVDGQHAGLITYMRTDSTRLSDDFIKEAKPYIVKNYTSEYYSGPRVVKNKEGAQDAHEGIRPTHVDYTPEKLANVLEADELKVYTLIYNRALASLMVEAKVEDTEISIYNGVHKFGITGKKIVFEGFMKLYEEFNEDEEDSKLLPAFQLKEKINAGKVKVERKETTPPGRYTEASLVKKMEEAGIGRPSTYAATMDTLRDRLYLEDIKGKTLQPSEMGIKVIDLLNLHFSELISSEYTSNMESVLDKIAEGTIDKVSELRKFYDKFEPDLAKALKEAVSVKEAPIESDKFCPKCGSVMFIRKSKFGEFYACSKFPKCKHTESMVKETVSTDIQTGVVLPTIATHSCPECGSGQIVPRVSKKGKNAGSIFYACNRFPKCKTSFSEEQFKEKFENTKPKFSDLSTDKY